MTSSDASGALVPLAEHITPGPRPEQSPGLVDQIRAAWLLAQPSPHTRQAYAGDFDTWRGFLDGLGVDVLAARRTHADAWARVREASQDAPATLARRLAAVSAFYAFAAVYVDELGLAEDVDVTNPFSLVRRPRQDAGTSTRALTAGEYAQLLAAAAEEPPVWGARDAAVVTVLGLNGFRVSTLTALNVDDLGVQGAHRTISYRVKGGRRKEAPLASVTLVYLNSHLDARRELGEFLPGEPLLLAGDGGRLDRHQVNRVLVRCARRAGLADPDGVHAHVLRATYLTVGEEAGISLRDLQQGADHQDPRTTEGYIKRGRRLDQSPTYRLANHILGAE
ncbi:tyrosine-type recombinase/integrase [Nocardiopsis deserti]|uniref:tyrosine-type recombinase/integrase n=1 Tax=Nocardiopsis deserti TaxID=2605988 RepID=UPI0012386584|nr:tyrosine-type recombinase/integrase [Nocardiopsis deserti]